MDSNKIHDIINALSVIQASVRVQKRKNMIDPKLLDQINDKTKEIVQLVKEESKD